MEASTPLESCDQRGHGGMLGFTDNAILLKSVFAAAGAGTPLPPPLSLPTVCCGGLQHWLLSGHTDCPVCRASINLSSPLDGVWITTAERAEGINDSINTVGVAGTVTLEGLEASAV